MTIGLNLFIGLVIMVLTIVISWYSFQAIKHVYSYYKLGKTADDGFWGLLVIKNCKSRINPTEAQIYLYDNELHVRQEKERVENLNHVQYNIESHIFFKRPNIRNGISHTNSFAEIITNLK